MGRRFLKCFSTVAVLLCKIVECVTMVDSIHSKEMVLAMLLINMKWVTSKAFADYNITGTVIISSTAGRCLCYSRYLCIKYLTSCSFILCNAHNFVVQLYITERERKGSFGC